MKYLVLVGNQVFVVVVIVVGAVFQPFLLLKKAWHRVLRIGFLIRRLRARSKPQL